MSFRFPPKPKKRQIRLSECILAPFDPRRPSKPGTAPLSSYDVPIKRTGLMSKASVAVAGVKLQRTGQSRVLTHHFDTPRFVSARRGVCGTLTASSSGKYRMRDKYGTRSLTPVEVFLILGWRRRTAEALARSCKKSRLLYALGDSVAVAVMKEVLKSVLYSW